MKKNVIMNLFSPQLLLQSEGDRARRKVEIYYIILMERGPVDTRDAMVVVDGR